MTTRKRMSSKSLNSKSDVSTVQNASLTASLEYTRGKELVEHDPWLLIPDPNNPRPGEIIDDGWLHRVLKLGKPDSLCFASEGGWVVPKFDSLSGDLGGAKKEDYEFLVQLSESIRHDGLIEPIEIFLADKKYEPEYFHNIDLEHGYVVLEGHQRRLAAMLGGINRVTCIKITDEGLLARLKVKHRKLRRQLSENNLRKEVSAGQHYQIVKQLFSTLMDGEDLSASELSQISGLNIKSAETLKKVVCAKEGRYPSVLYKNLLDDALSMRKLRDLSSKSFDEINDYFSPVLTPVKTKAKVKVRGMKGGRVKRSVSFKLSNEDDTVAVNSYLAKVVPELEIDEDESSPFKQLESLLKQLVEKAKNIKG